MQNKEGDCLGHCLLAEIKTPKKPIFTSMSF